MALEKSLEEEEEGADNLKVDNVAAASIGELVDNHKDSNQTT